MASVEAPRTCSCPLPLRGCALLKAATAGRLPAKAEDLHCTTMEAVNTQWAGSSVQSPGSGATHRLASCPALPHSVACMVKSVVVWR